MPDKLHTPPRPALAVDTRRRDVSSTSLARDGLSRSSNGATAGAEAASAPPTSSAAGVRVARAASPSRDAATLRVDVEIVRERIGTLNFGDNRPPLDGTNSSEREAAEGAQAAETATPDHRLASESSNLASSASSEKARRRSLDWIPTPLDGLIKKDSVLAFVHEPSSWHCYEISRLIGTHRHY